MNQKKDKRREAAIARFTKELEDKVRTVGKEEKVPLTLGDVTRIQKDIANTIKLIGKKKPSRSRKRTGILDDSKGDKWIIDIFTVTYGYIKRSERKKNKGKSTKKMKKHKSVSFVRSVIAQPGMIQSLREGRMGISPKTHTFRLRKEEISQMI